MLIITGLTTPSGCKPISFPVNALFSIHFPVYFDGTRCPQSRSSIWQPTMGLMHLRHSPNRPQTFQPVDILVPMSLLNASHILRRKWAVQYFTTWQQKKYRRGRNKRSGWTQAELKRGKAGRKSRPMGIENPNGCPNVTHCTKTADHNTKWTIK